jgi:hypothetical protein
MASFIIPERRAMKDAKAAIIARHGHYDQSGPWLKIGMPYGAALWLCPASGSLRWDGGIEIFSSQGLPRALELMDEYGQD